jgi:hypothetical protein
LTFITFKLLAFLPGTFLLLKRYAGDDKFKKTIGQTTVVKLVLIFCGNELEYIGKAK